jgi:hypothetical protein
MRLKLRLTRPCKATINKFSLSRYDSLQPRTIRLSLIRGMYVDLSFLFLVSPFIFFYFFFSQVLQSTRYGDANRALREVQSRHDDIKKIEKTILVRRQTNHASPIVHSSTHNTRGCHFLTIFGFICRGGHFCHHLGIASTVY